MSKNIFSVVLHQVAANDLEAILSPWLKSNEKLGAYVNCTTADTLGPYLRLVMDFPDTTNEVEIQIPHLAAKAVIRTVELKRLGFV